MNNPPKTGITLVILLVLTFFFAGCTDKPDVFTIGIVTQIPKGFPAFEGFKSGMDELGYIEGKNLRYIYSEIESSDEQVIYDEIRRVINSDIDLLLTFEDDITLKAKEIVTGTDMPLLFTANPQPIELDLVDSFSHPGGNLTGVRIADTTLKALEWLVLIVPNAKKIYIPYDPEDDVSMMHVSRLGNFADNLGVELVFDEIHSLEEAITAIQTLPDDVNAVLRIHCPILNQVNEEFCRAAINRGIPVGASLVQSGDVLMIFTSSFKGAGKQAARLAHQIHNGIKPADLPVEVADVYFSINLKTAEKIGIDIPEDILMQAKTIIR